MLGKALHVINDPRIVVVYKRKSAAAEKKLRQRAGATYVYDIALFATIDGVNYHQSIQNPWQSVFGLTSGRFMVPDLPQHVN